AGHVRGPVWPHVAHLHAHRGRVGRGARPPREGGDGATQEALARTSEREEYMAKLEGKIALITGGNSGIGLATAQQFVNEGAYVFITGRREQELARAVEEIGRNVIG